VYYAVLLFGGKLFEPMKKWFVKRSYRCPYCKSRHTIVLGLDNYLGDCPYYFYKCNDCGQESIDVDGTLVQPVKWKKPLQWEMRRIHDTFRGIPRSLAFGDMGMPSAPFIHSLSWMSGRP